MAALYANFTFLFRQKQIACKLPLEEQQQLLKEESHPDKHAYKLERERGIERNVAIHETEIPYE